MNTNFYDKVELTEEEVKEALLEGRKKKFFREKFRPYWEAKEKEKPGKKVGQTL